MTSSNNTSSNDGSFGEQIQKLNLFQTDPKDINVDMKATKVTDVGNGLEVAFAPVTVNGKNAVLFSTVPTRTPFGIDNDREKKDKYSLVQTLESKNPNHQPAIKAVIEKLQAFDERITQVMAANSSDENWWGVQKDANTLAALRTPSVKPAGVSKKNKRPFGPSIKFAVHIDRKTQEPLFQSYIKNQQGTFDQATQDLLKTIPPNSIVQVVFGFPQVWKSSDKAWGIRWKLVQVYRHGISSSGFRLPQHQIITQAPSYDMDIEKDFGDGETEDGSQPMELDEDEVY